MTQETFEKAKELDSKINELNYRIDRKLEEIKIFQEKYNESDTIRFFDFSELSIELFYEEALNKMRDQLHTDQQTLFMVQIQFNNL